MLDRSVGKRMRNIIRKSRGVMRGWRERARWWLYRPTRYPITRARRAHRRMYCLNFRLNFLMPAPGSSRIYR